MPEVTEKNNSSRGKDQVLKNIAKRGQREAASRQNRNGDVAAHYRPNPDRPAASVPERKSTHNGIVGSRPKGAELLR